MSNDDLQKEAETDLNKGTRKRVIQIAKKKESLYEDKKLSYANRSSSISIKGSSRRQSESFLRLLHFYNYLSLYPTR